MRLFLIITFMLTGLACSAPLNPWLESGESSATQGDLDSAIAFYELAYQDLPGDDAVRLRLAALLERRAGELTEASESALAVDRLERALVLYRGDASPELRHKLVIALQGADVEPERELNALRAALAQGADEPELIRRMAMLLEDVGQVEASRDAWAALDAVGETTASELMHLARLQASTEQVEAALDSYGRYLEREPSSTIARVALSRLLEKKGDTPGAEALLREVVEAFPERPRSWKELLAFYERHGNADGVDEARAHIQALTQQPDRKLRPLK